MAANESSDEACTPAWTENFDCVHNSTEYAALILGLSSIGFWLLAQGPQLYLNYQRKSACSLSMIFLLMWLLGDITNLVGCVLTDQLPTQLYTAIYFCVIDFFMVSQWAYYEWLSKSNRYDLLAKSKMHAPRGAATISELSELPLPNGKPHYLRVSKPLVLSMKSVGVLLFFPVCIFAIHKLSYYAPLSLVQENALTGFDLSHEGYPGFMDFHMGHGGGVENAAHYADDLFDTHHVRPALRGGRRLLEVTAFSNAQNVIGYLIGLVSGALYLMSRLPQILKNHRRKSTEGLSLSMFILAVLGNTTYALGIFLKGHTSDFIIDHLPWIVGSAGVLCLDSVIFMQFMFLENKPGPLDLVLLNFF